MQYYKFVNMPLTPEEALAIREKELQFYQGEIDRAKADYDHARSRPLLTEKKEMVPWEEGDPPEEREWMLSNLTDEAGKLGGLIQKKIHEDGLEICSPWINLCPKGTTTKPKP